MILTVAQSQQYRGDDWWDWAVWIEGSEADLDQIEEVIYRLHSSFPKPLRTMKNRQDCFKLESAGWGTFCIPVKVVLKNGETRKLMHELELLYPDGTANTD
jgi:transcription initiation factor IIF auxiliary subunit